MALTHQEPEYLTGHTDGVFGGHEPVVLDVAEDYVRVPNGDFLLSAEYSQFGPDLSLSGDGIEVLVKDYFTFETAPDLLNADGTAVIGGALASKLAGPITPGQFAQLAQSVSVPSVGVIESLEGAVQLTRTDGSTVQAEKGSKVFVGDIVKTEANANVGIKFVDDTSFALGESGRLVIDELIYDPSGNSGQSSFSVVNGVFSFVSGQIAKVGDDAMQVTTPVATIGIRGTTVAGKAAAEGSANTITLLPDAGGGVGQIAVSNSAGTQIMSVPFQTTSLSSAFTAPPVPVVLPANQLQNLYGKIQNVLPPTTNTQQQQQNKSEDEAGPAAKGDTEEASGEKEGEKEGEAGEGEGENTEQQGEGVEEEDKEADKEGAEKEGERSQEDGEETPDGRPENSPEAKQEQSASGVEGEGSSKENKRPQGTKDAKDAFEEARKEGLSEEEAFEKAASALGGSEEEKDIAEAAYKKAIAEGKDPREAVFIAEDAVRDSFYNRKDLNPLIAEREASIEEAISKGASAKEALTQQLTDSDISYEDIRAVEQAAFRSLKSAFNNDDGEGLAFVLDASGSTGIRGEDAFKEALLSGASIDEAFGAAFEANVAASGGRAEGEQVDYLANSLYNQGFDPQLRVVSVIRDSVQEAQITTFASFGTIASFSERIDLTEGTDIVQSGAGLDTSFL